MNYPDKNTVRRTMPTGKCSGCGDIGSLPPFGEGMCFLCATEGPPGDTTPTGRALHEDFDARREELPEPDEAFFEIRDLFAEAQGAYRGWTGALGAEIAGEFGAFDSYAESRAAFVGAGLSFVDERILRPVDVIELRDAMRRDPPPCGWCGAKVPVLHGCRVGSYCGASCRHKARKAIRQQQGKCLRCGDVLDTDRRQCRACLVAVAKFGKKRRLRLEKDRLCCACGRPAEQYTRCNTCLAKRYHTCPACGRPVGRPKLCQDCWNAGRVNLHDVGGMKLSVAAMSAMTGVEKNTMYARLRRMSPKEAFTRPARLREIPPYTPFGDLFVLATRGFSPNRKRLYLCQCKCGKVKEILGNSLTTGRTTSCGCRAAAAASKRASERNRKPGLSDYEALLAWAAERGTAFRVVDVHLGIMPRVVRSYLAVATNDGRLCRVGRGLYQVEDRMVATGRALPPSARQTPRLERDH